MLSNNELNYINKGRQLKRNKYMSEVMITKEKRLRAEGVIANPVRYEEDSAEKRLLNKAIAEKVEDKVLYIYKGLGGVLVTKEKAKKVEEARTKIAEKQRAKK